MGILRITLARKIRLLLLLPLMGSLAAGAFFAAYLHATRGDAHVINVAGRQRMLSAELRSWTHMVAIGQEEDRQGLRQRIEEFAASLGALREGGIVLNSVLNPAPAEVRPALDDVADLWRELKPDLDLVADAPRASPPFRKAYGRAESRLQDLRDRSNRVVTAFEARTERLKRRMRNILAGLAGVMGLLFIIGLALVTAMERRYYDVVENASDGIVVMGQDGIISHFNRAAEKMFGYERSRVIGRPVTLLMPEKYRKQHERGVERYLETGQSRVMGAAIAIEGLREDGSIFPMEGSFSVYRVGTEAIFTGILRDVSERQRAEEVLRESEERFRQMAESIGEVFWMTDIERSKMLYVSPAYEKIWGRTRESLFASPRDWLDAIHPEDKDRVLEAALTKQSRGDYEEEYRIMRPDGSVRWILDRAFPVKDASGRVYRIVGAAEDITARVMAEKKFRTLLDSSPDAIIVADEQGKIVLVNLRAERMFGFKREELIGQSVETLMPERFRAGHVKYRSDYGDNPEIRPMGAGRDLYALRKDGGEFPVDIAISPIRTPEGLLVMSSIRDLTEIKRNQADLRRANRNLKTLSEFNQRLIRNPDATTLAWDLCRIIIEHGKYHSAQVVLAGPDEKTGPRVMARAGCWKAFPDQGSDPWKGNETGGRIEACARTGRPEIANHILTDPDCVSWRAEALRCGYGAAIALPLTDAKGRTYGTLMVSADELDAFDGDTVKLLTELAGDLDHGIMAFRARIEHEQMQEVLLQNQTQLRQSQKMEAVGRLAGGIAHDFNNLLTAILGYGTFLLQNLKPDDPNRADILEIEAAAKRAAALTKQLLAFSRKQMLSPQRMDINVVVKEMQAMLRRLIGEDIELAILPWDKPLVVKADRGQTEQVVMNLAINARDAMPNTGKIIIETTPIELDEAYVHRHGNIPPGSYVMLAVSDTGCGMSEAVQAHLFEPFFTTKEKGKGTGLGLSTVYGIVAQSEGHITAYSEEGRGTTFRIYLPRLGGQAENGESAAAQTELPRGSGTVLLVEDEASVRELARRALTLNGFTVIATGNPLEALTLCERHQEPIRLLVTDMVMPKLNGLELARKARTARPGIPVLYMSGYTEHAVFQQGIEELKGAFLQKPFVPRGLLEKVHEILRARP